MNKTIITVQGTANMGKTQTLKQFRELLLHKYPDAQDPNIFDTTGDFRTIISIPSSDDSSIKIGIATDGDIGWCLKNHLDGFINEKCDIIFCACRTKRSTPRAVCEASKNGYDVIWTSTSRCWKDDSREEFQKELNKLSAVHLLKLMKLVIK